MINLLPPIIKENRDYGRKNLSLLGYSIALLATALMTAGIMVVSLQFIGAEEPELRKKNNEDQQTIAKLEEEVKKVESIATQLQTAKKINDLSISFSELIPKIGAVLPDGVILNALSFTGGPTDPLQLDVDLTNASLAAILIRNLDESELFEAADISSLSPRGTGTAADTTETNTYSFTASITASFTGTAEAAKKAKAAEAAKKAAADAAAAAKEKN